MRHEHGRRAFLVAFLEGRAQQLSPYQPQVVVGLSGITVG
jgi:hypothetical protein